MGVEIPMRTRLEEAILVILATEGRPVGRTRLVKLLFLADLEALRRGRPTFTSGKWRYHRFGPHQWEAIDAAEDLGRAGLLHRIPWEVSTGNAGTDYGPGAHADAATTLEAPEQELLRELVMGWKDRSLDDLRAFVYALPVISTAKKGLWIDLNAADPDQTAFEAALARTNAKFSTALRELAQ